MSMTVDQIVQETSQWPAERVAELLDRILVAKHGGLSPQRESAWNDVARQRLADLDSGKGLLVPGNEVSARVRSIVGR